MIALLRTLESPGLPRDWLLARARGRAAAAPTPPVAEAWRTALAEVRWLYPRLEPAGREEYAPLFALIETRPLARALRCAHGGEIHAAIAALDGSLLAPTVIELFRRETGAAERLQRLARHPAVCTLPGWSVERAERNPRDFEATLHDALLLTGRQGRVLGDLFCRLIDLRNLLVLGKGERWQIGDRPLLPQGSLSERRLRALLQRDEALPRLVAGLERSLRSGLCDPLAAQVIPHRLVLTLLRDLQRQVTEAEAA